MQVLKAPLIFVGQVDQLERISCRSRPEIDTKVFEIGIVMLWVAPDTILPHLMQLAQARRSQIRRLGSLVVGQGGYAVDAVS